MTMVRAAAGILGLCAWTALATPAAAQDTASSAVAREVASLMAERQLDAFAVDDSEAASRFDAALLIPGVQLLVVSAEYPAPDELKAQLGRKNYRDVYAALHQPVSAPTRFFVIDLACDGLTAKGGSVDILYEKDTTETLFNGDWKTQGLTEAGYRTRLENADRQYTRVLTRLRDALKAPPSGVQ